MIDHHMGLNRISFAVAISLLFAGINSTRAAFWEPQSKQLAGYQEQYRELSAAYSARLRQIADTAQRAGFAEDAKAIRDLAIPFDPGKIQSDPLPRHTQPKLPISLPQNEAWRLELRKLREDHAIDLYRLSRLMLSAKFPSAAYHLVREVAIADPDHGFARKILGWQQYKDEWITPFEASQSLKRMVWHDKYGWLLKTYVDRYEQGERFFNREWMPAAQENAVRQAFQNAWEIRTEHFLVKTNHSLERGVEVAKKLEEFHDFFVQTFPAFFYSPGQLQDLFHKAGRSSRGQQTQPFVVHYYRTRDEYNQELVQKIPQIAITNGLYHNGDRVAYFFHDPKENNDSTLFHEATHQLLFETRFTPRNARHVGMADNFWIIEGLACYMESLKLQDGKQTLGNPEFVRFYWARNRFLSEKFYIPLTQFASMGMREFQSQPQQDLSRSYSQASGLVHFFMHYKDGVYRDALVEHISQIYDVQRQFQPESSLADLTEVPFAELDQEYAGYLKDQQRALDHRQPLAPASE